MEHLQIKKEFPAQRCEICHQADCFDPIANVCTRCQSVMILRPHPDAVEPGNEKQDVSETLKRDAEAVGFLSGVGFTVILAGSYLILLQVGENVDPDGWKFISAVGRWFFVSWAVAVVGQIFGRELSSRLQSQYPDADYVWIKRRAQKTILWLTASLVLGLWLLLGQICG